MNNIDYILQKLQEECAEVICIASKCFRFGLYGFHPKHKELNVDALTREIKDVLFVLEKMEEYGIIKQIVLSVEERSLLESRFYKYLEISKTLKEGNGN